MLVGERGHSMNDLQALITERDNVGRLFDATARCGDLAHVSVALDELLARLRELSALIAEEVAA